MDDELSWKWLAGEQTDATDFGDPTTTTNYELCVFDGSGAAFSYVLFNAAEDCGGKSCWHSTSTGYGYSRKLEGDDGTTSSARLTLRAGEDGKAKIIASATGGQLEIGGLPPEAPVIVQLRVKDGPCWEATYSAPASSSDAGTFSDRAD